VYQKSNKRKKEKRKEGERRKRGKKKRKNEEIGWEDSNRGRRTEWVDDRWELELGI